MKKTLFIIGLIFILACSDVKDIEEIKNNPREYEDKEVIVKGVVIETFSTPFVNYFEIADKTDTISVITSKSLPAKGQEIKIAGEVMYYTLFSESILIIFEKDTTL